MFGLNEKSNNKIFIVYRENHIILIATVNGEFWKCFLIRIRILLKGQANECIEMNAQLPHYAKLFREFMN